MNKAKGQLYNDRDELLLEDFCGMLGGAIESSLDMNNLNESVGQSKSALVALENEMQALKSVMESERSELEQKLKV